MNIKRWIAFLLMLAWLCTAGIVSILADEAEDLTVTNGCHSLDGTQSLLGSSRLTENASSVFVYETKSQTIMYQWDSDKQVHPASLVKIMTGLLVVENGDLSDTVTVSQSALDSVSRDAISVELQAGEQISVDNLMYCMLVYSANDAAAVLAEYIAGSQPAFVDKMNERAAQLGCTGTVFVNAHGLHDDAQVTTARDLAKILDAALTYDAFRTFFGTAYYQVPATNLHKERNLSSNNYLMNKDAVGIYLDNRVTGGRTGITSEGYRNIASLSESGNMELICIVMDAASTLSETGRTEVYGGFPETIDFMNRAYNGYTRRQILYPNQILRQTPVVNGDNELFVTSYQGFSTVLPNDMPLEQLTFTYEDTANSTQAPIVKGQNVASLQVWYGSICIAQTDVFAMNNVAVAFEKTKPLQHEGKPVSWLAIVLIVVIAIVVGFAVYILLARMKAKKVAAAQMRNHARRRR